ncbi:MAG TPA: ferredoxin [Bacillota bacterium]|jgi:ferredoxin|nr:ferredoxin [Bacillota bacterium]HOL10429.1 ferredoxin [Bacillota bacterium]HPO98367.1 ferredoxin [Bacillota bacterium]
MKVSVSQDLCISCGLCVSNCPEVFDWNDEEKAEATVDEVPEDLEDCVQDSANSCPTEAIETD